MPAVLRTPVFENHAGFVNRFIVPRLKWRAVERHMVNAGCVGVIGVPFVGPRIVHPRRFPTSCRERLRRHLFVSKHMGSGSGPLALFVRAARAVSVPERGGRTPNRLHNFHPVKSRAGKRFRTEFHTVLLTQLHQIPKEIVVDTVGNRPAEIVKKALRHLDAVNDPSGQNRQERIEAVAAAFFKLRRQYGRPVLPVRLPAIDCEIGQVFARLNPIHFEERFAKTVEMKLNRLAAEFIRFEPARFLVPRPSAGARTRRTHPQNRPLSCRGIPIQLSTVVHPLGQIDHLGTRDHIGRRDRIRRGFTQHRLVFFAVFSHPFFDSQRLDLIPRDLRHRKHLDVLVVADIVQFQCAGLDRTIVRFFNRNRDCARTGNFRLAPDDILHALFGRNPRSANRAEAFRHIHR